MNTIGDFIKAIPAGQIVMALALLGALFVIIRSLLRKSVDGESHINLDDLVLEWNPVAGKWQMSIIRVLALGAFALTVWIMVALTMSGKMTEGYFGIFGGLWVGPLLSYIIWGKKPPILPAGPTTTIKADNVQVENP